MKAKEMVTLAACTAILLVAQVTFAYLPNIELVSLLLILFTLLFQRKVFYIVYGFALLEGALYGFSLWWATYLYVWNILVFLTWLFRRQTSPFFWAVLSGLYGLSFGALCSVPTFLTGCSTGGLTAGLQAALSWWINGIPFDILHCLGNFAAALVLYRPLLALSRRLLRYSSESKSI